MQVGTGSHRSARGACATCVNAPFRTATALVSRHFHPRNTLSDVTYATMDRLDLTFVLLGA